MFSKALFKQSCKANRTGWSIITFAVCFMLACVMLISGNGNIGEVKNSIQDTIITKEVDAQMQKRALSYYADAIDGMENFDRLFAANATDTLSYLNWLSKMPSIGDASYGAWQNLMPSMQTDCGKTYAENITTWQNSMPARESFSSDAEYLSALQEWQSLSPATQEQAVTAAYASACEELQTAIEQNAADKGYAKTDDVKEDILTLCLCVVAIDGKISLKERKYVKQLCKA